MSLLEGKTVMVTGAAAGIGEAAAHLFVAEGARVILCDIDQARLESVAESLGGQPGDVRTCVADVSVESEVGTAVELALESWGRLDAAFNNAGITGPMAPIGEYATEWVRRVCEVNVYGTLNCLQAQIPVMVRNGSGAIVNASSCAGLVGSVGMAAYSASKHAILGLTKVAALENAAKGVRVNAVLPGVIDTSQPRLFTKDVPGAFDALAKAMPIGRLGAPEEVAEAAAWLCSDRASLVTGHGLAVDGGFMAQ
jgi:A-factor type gamma-butyrolactone 1'-reductase (1S-forming)